MTVGGHLLRRLKEIGAGHLFGVPGDFVLGFLNAVLESDIEYVGCCNELNAAYAADGYARIRGVGALCTTFGAGELSAVNGVAGAFAEKVPLVMIIGSPARPYFQTQPLLHHTLGDYRIPQAIYEKITVASALLMSAESAPAEIDRVLSACLAFQKPVYISLPSDLVAAPCAEAGPFAFPQAPSSDPAALQEAVQEALAMLFQAKTPVLIGGVDLIRHRLQADFADLLAKTGFPYATMMLGKTLLSERHPQFIGLFEGERSPAAVRQRVQSADCVIQLGALMCDFNTGGFSSGFDASKTILAGLDHLQIRNHHYDHVRLPDFMRGLSAARAMHGPAPLQIRQAAHESARHPSQAWQPQAAQALSIQRFFDRLSHFLKDGSIVVAETGVALFSAAEMLMPEGATFIAQAFYGSIGYTVGATLGAAVAAPERPAVLLVGDGSFQVAAQELSTMIRRGLKVVIFLLNNGGYTIERVIADRSYNDIQPWAYHALPEAFGGSPGLDVHTEGELEEALAKAATAESLVFIEIHTGRFDCPESLKSAGKAMALANHLA